MPQGLMAKLATMYRNQNQNVNITQEIDKIARETANLKLVSPSLSRPTAPSISVYTAPKASSTSLKTNLSAPNITAHASVKSTISPTKHTFQNSSSLYQTYNTNGVERQSRPTNVNSTNTKPPPPPQPPQPPSVSNNNNSNNYTMNTSFSNSNPLAAASNLGVKSSAAFNNRDFIMNQSMMNSSHYRMPPQSFAASSNFQLPPKFLQQSGSGHQYHAATAAQQQKYSSNISLPNSFNQSATSNNEHVKSTVMPLSKLIIPNATASNNNNNNNNANSSTTTTTTTGSTNQLNRRSVINPDLITNSSLKVSNLTANSSPIKMQRNSSVPPPQTNNMHIARSIYQPSSVNESTNKTLQYFYSGQMPKAAASMQTTGTITSSHLPPLPSNNNSNNNSNGSSNLTTTANQRLINTNANKYAQQQQQQLYQQQQQQQQQGVKYVASPLQFVSTSKPANSPPSFADFYQQQQQPSYFQTAPSYDTSQLFNQAQQQQQSRQSMQLSAQQQATLQPQQSYYYLAQQQTPMLNTKFGDLKNRNSVYGLSNHI